MYRYIIELAIIPVQKIPNHFRSSCLPSGLQSCPLECSKVISILARLPCCRRTPEELCSPDERTSKSAKVSTLADLPLYSVMMAKETRTKMHARNADLLQVGQVPVLPVLFNVVAAHICLDIDGGVLVIERSVAQFTSCFKTDPATRKALAEVACQTWPCGKLCDARPRQTTSPN